MSVKPLIAFTTMIRANPKVRFGWTIVYYLAILLGVVLLHGQSDFDTPSFVYQGF